MGSVQRYHLLTIILVLIGLISSGFYAIYRAFTGNYDPIMIIGLAAIGIIFIFIGIFGLRYSKKLII
jgi:amino acid transporter